MDVLFEIVDRAIELRQAVFKDEFLAALQEVHGGPVGAQVVAVDVQHRLLLR